MLFLMQNTCDEWLGLRTDKKIKEVNSETENKGKERKKGEGGIGHIKP